MLESASIQDLPVSALEGACLLWATVGPASGGAQVRLADAMTPLINKSLSQTSHAAQAAFDQAVVTLLGERRYDHAWQLLGEHATEAGRLSGRLAAQLLTDADTKILLQDTTVTGRVVASALAAQAPATAVWRDKKRFATLC